MKRYFSILLYIAVFACETKTQSQHKSISSNQSEEITVSVDTLTVPINGDLHNIVWFRNSFYGLFETSRKNTTAYFKKMITFDKKGEVIEDVFIPKEIQDMVYCNLIVDNDSLYAKEAQFDKVNLVLGHYVADFKVTKTKDFPIFKDSSFSIYSVCHGEFGGTIYFQNKTTKISYEAASTCPIVVNKLNSKYFVTNSKSILKIAAPEKLARSKLDLKTHQASLSTEGVEMFFNSSGFDFYIFTSIVSDKKLLNLYSDKQGTYIGEIENKNMNPIYKFNFKFSAYLNQQLDNRRQILTCYFADSKPGILIIDGKHFNFYRLK